MPVNPTHFILHIMHWEEMYQYKAKYFVQYKYKITACAKPKPNITDCTFKDWITSSILQSILAQIRFSSFPDCLHTFITSSNQYI